MNVPVGGSGLGERVLHPQGVWDWVVRWGIFSVALTAIVGLVIALIRFLIWPMRVAFAPVALALVVVFLLSPLVNLLERRGVRRGLAVAICYLSFVAIAGVALALVVPVIARQIGGFVGHLPQYVQDATQDINEFAARRGWDFRIDLMSTQVQQYVLDNREQIIGVLGGVRSLAFGLIHILITVVIGAILSIYILLDMPKIKETIRSVIPRHRRDELSALSVRIAGALGAFFRGQLLVAIFVGLASALGLTLVKIPFAAVVGLIAGVFNLVPLIGPFIGAIPAVILGLLSGEPTRALWGGLVLLAVQQIDNHIISPNVIGRTVRLHPITVMLALLVAGSQFGIFGMLLVIPVISAIKEIARYLWESHGLREAVEEQLETAG